LTVMFCDLVGSTPLSVRFDPEDLRKIIAAYHRSVAEIVAGLDGFVSRCFSSRLAITKCRDCAEQPAAVADRRNAELAQILARQLA
jgi:class 3 adenylate cyclase